MLVKNLNCKYLEVFSEEYQQLIFNNNLASITVKATLNEGEVFERTVEYPIPSKTWSKQAIPISGDVAITGFFIENIFTGLEFNFLEYPFIIGSVAGVNDFKTFINNSFLTKFDKAVVQTSVTNFTDGVAVSFDYTIKNLPYYLRASQIEFRQEGVLSREYFTVSSLDGMSFGESSIILTPEFFDLDVNSFSDAVVNINLKLRTKARRFSNESTCFFIDCTLKSLLPSIHNFECVDQSTNIIMLHYSLTQASNTDCNCGDMYIVFQYVKKELGKLSNNIQDCGC